MTPAEVVEFCKKEKIDIIDLKFTDLPGTLQHISLPLRELTEENMAAGYGFDGSSIRGFKAIEESEWSMASMDLVFGASRPSKRAICS